MSQYDNVKQENNVRYTDDVIRKEPDLTSQLDRLVDIWLKIRPGAHITLAWALLVPGVTIISGPGLVQQLIESAVRQLADFLELSLISLSFTVNVDPLFGFLLIAASLLFFLVGKFAEQGDSKLKRMLVLSLTFVVSLIISFPFYQSLLKSETTNQQLLQQALSQVSHLHSDQKSVVTALTESLKALARQPDSEQKTMALQQAAKGDFKAASAVLFDVASKLEAKQLKRFNAEASNTYLLSGKLAMANSQSTAKSHFQKALTLDQGNEDAQSSLADILDEETQVVDATNQDEIQPDSPSTLESEDTYYSSHKYTASLSESDAMLMADVSTSSVKSSSSQSASYQQDGELTSTDNEYTAANQPDEGLSEDLSAGETNTSSEDESINPQESLEDEPFNEFYANQQPDEQSPGQNGQHQENQQNKQMAQHVQDLSEQASELADEGKIYQAERLYNEAIDLSKKLGNNGQTMALVNELGHLYLYNDESEQAEQLFRQGLSLSEENGDARGMANQYANLAKTYELAGEPELAEDYYRQAINTMEVAGEADGMTMLYANLGNLYMAEDNFQAAERAYQQGIQYGTTNHDLTATATNLANLGNLYHVQGDFSQAERHLMQALQISSQQNYADMSASLSSELGALYLSQSNLAQAETWFHQAFQLSKDLNDVAGMSSQLAALGNVSQLAGKAGAAEQYYLQAIDLSESAGVNEHLGMLYNELGHIYQQQNNPEQAAHYYEQSAQAAAEQHQPDQLAYSLLNLGQSQVALGLYTEALASLTQARNRFLQMGDEEGAALARQYAQEVRRLTGG